MFSHGSQQSAQPRTRGLKEGGVESRAQQTQTLSGSTQGPPRRALYDTREFLG